MATQVRDPAFVAAERARALVPRLKALADENRLILLLLLAERPQTVRELELATGLGQALVSHHLKALREHGLVTSSPRGRSNVYSLCCGDTLAEQIRFLADLSPDSAS